MSKLLPAQPPRSRYSYQAATIEIARALKDEDRGTQKELAVHLHLTEPQFSHRMRGKNARFSVEHFGAVADFFGGPPGWPFVPAGELWFRSRRKTR